MQAQKGSSCIWIEGVKDTLKVFGPPSVRPKKGRNGQGKRAYPKGQGKDQRSITSPIAAIRYLLPHATVRELTLSPHATLRELTPLLCFGNSSRLGWRWAGEVVTVLKVTGVARGASSGTPDHSGS